MRVLALCQISLLTPYLAKIQNLISWPHQPGDKPYQLAMPIALSPSCRQICSGQLQHCAHHSGLQLIQFLFWNLSEFLGSSVLVEGNEERKKWEVEGERRRKGRLERRRRMRDRDKGEEQEEGRGRKKEEKKEEDQEKEEDIIIQHQLFCSRQNFPFSLYYQKLRRNPTSY